MKALVQVIIRCYGVRVSYKIKAIIISIMVTQSQSTSSLTIIHINYYRKPIKHMILINHCFTLFTFTGSTGMDKQGD